MTNGNDFAWLDIGAAAAAAAAGAAVDGNADVMVCEGLLFAVVVGVIIGIAVGFVFLLMVCVCKHRCLPPPRHIHARYAPFTLKINFEIYVN